MNYFELDQAKPLTLLSETNPTDFRSNTIKLLTYNLFLRPPGIKTNKSDYKDDRLTEFMNIMGDYDIICLQEVFGTFNSRKERLIKQALKKGFYFIESSPDPSFFSKYLIDGGLVILSKFPIVSTELYFFSHGDFPDCLTFRGVIYAKIEVSGEILHLFTGHTQATYLGNENGIKKNIVTRLCQLEELSVFIEKCLEKNDFQENHLALFLADFNVDAKGEKFPLNYVETFQRKELLSTNGEFFNEYETLLKILSINKKYIIFDLLRNNYNGRSPPTYGESKETENGQLIPTETILTALEDLNINHCLDYFLQIFPNTEKIISNNNGDNKIFIDEKSIRIEKFFIAGREFTQLSDHYGISGNLKVMMKKEESDFRLEISK